MVKVRRSLIHYRLAMDAAYGKRRGARDAELEPKLEPVTLDSDDQQNLLATLEAHLPPSVHAQVCEFLDDCRDDPEAEDGNNQTDADVEPLRKQNGEDDSGPGGGGIKTAGFPKTKAQDRHLSFDERFPTHIRNLGGSEPARRPAPASRRSGPSFDERFGPDASRVRTV
jgi:hypothetical protein